MYMLYNNFISQGGKYMVRDYNKSDIDIIIQLFEEHNELSKVEKNDLRNELENGKKVLVYENGHGIEGICSLDFWKNTEWGNCIEIIMSIKEDAKFEEIANTLWEAAQVPIKEKNVVFLNTHYNEKHNKWRKFYSEKQFERWFGIHGMIYKGGNFEETKLNFRNYEENDFDMYYTYLGECFSPMRKANDIRPFDIFKGSSLDKIANLKKGMQEQKDYTYLFFDGKDFVGSSIIKYEEIDDLFVVPELQGRGYGRKIMEATINMTLKRNFDRITLGAVAWNKPAINLYKSLGFEIYQSFEHVRLVLNKG